MAQLPTNVLVIPHGAKRKSFRPLENNPAVMTRLAGRLGLSDSLRFVDIYSIDDTDLFGIIPRPCYGLILVFPINEAYESFRIQEDESLDDYDSSGDDEEVVWFKQTIGTGCGMIALLHCLANGDCPSFIRPASDLDHLLKQVRPLGPIPRANALCECEALEEANECAAVSGESSAPSANTPMDLHFVCFVKSKDDCLWELDGRRRGPINRGKLQADDDALSKRALELGVHAFVKREQEHGMRDTRFSLIVLVPSLAAPPCT